MKRIARILAVLAMVFVMVCALAVPVLAADPIVNITGATDRIAGGVNGQFGSGTVNWNLNATTGTHTITTTLTNINTGLGQQFNITTSGMDTTAWHPGVVGQTNSLIAAGNFNATYSSQTNGLYGILNSFVNASSTAGGAGFQMNDTQYFNIMSGNHEYNVVGNFQANAGGLDNQVAMNLKSIGSMYIYSEATNGGVGLQGNAISKHITSVKNDVPMTNLFMGVQTTGLASISNSNIWGFCNNESGTLSSTNYGGGTRTVTATGDGAYLQTGFGANTLNFNGFNLPGGGSATLSIPNFVGGLNGTYTMDAK